MTSRTNLRRYEDRVVTPPKSSFFPTWFKGAFVVAFGLWAAGISFTVWVILQIIDILRNWGG